MQKFLQNLSNIFSYVHTKLKHFKENLSMTLTRTLVNNAGEFTQSFDPKQSVCREIKGVIMLIKIFQLRTTVSLCKFR